MGDCEHCGETSVLTRTCNHCGLETCTEHILPENHDCPGLASIGQDTKHLQSDIDAKLSDDDDTPSSNRETSKRDTRVANDREGVTKDKKSRTPLEEYRKREEASKLVDNETDNSSSDIENTQLNQPTTDQSPSSSRTRAGGDSSPDVAPDGSLKPKDSELDRELERMRRDVNRTRRANRVRRTLRRLRLRLYLTILSPRVWVVVLVAVASMGQLGYVSIPGLPVDLPAF